MHCSLSIESDGHGEYVHCDDAMRYGCANGETFATRDRRGNASRGAKGDGGSKGRLRRIGIVDVKGKRL